MIGETKTEKINGKDYDIEKKGVNTALTVNSIFLELMTKAAVDQDKDVSESELSMGLLIAMRGRVLEDIKDIICDCVVAPKMTSKSYDKLDMQSVTQLFMQIYYLHVGGANKKKEKPAES